LNIRSAPIKTAVQGGRVDLTGIVQLVEEDLEAVNRMIAERLRSDIALINQLASYIINSGGKRLRPVTLLLAAGACQQKTEAHINLAAIVEFIHTATLLHDDVVDDSDMRRGKATANELWGNSASVLVGDFLYSRSFEMMVEIGSMRVMEIMAKTTNQIAEGEVLQLINCGSPDTTEERYLDTIRRKTAKLFESAAQLGAVASNQSSSVEHAMADYGLYLGTAFQLIDDVLDYGTDSDELGKNIGDDLAEGKPTLPLINAMARGTPAQKELLREAISNGGLEYIERVQEAIESTGSLAYTARRARNEAEKAQRALSIVPESPYKQALMDLAVFAVERNY
jgi:octaprenyl-diphosphate synthase